MSKNSKNARRIAEAKDRNRAKGYKGPKRTEPKHGKRNTWHAKLAGKVAPDAPRQRREEDTDE